MKNRYFQRIAAALLVAAFMTGGAAAGEDVSGRWYVESDRARYVMEITQRGHELFGRMVPMETKNSLPILLYGTINDERFSAGAHDRLFFVTLRMDGTVIGNGVEKTIHGRMTINGRHNYQWHAVRLH